MPIKARRMKRRRKFKCLVLGVVLMVVVSPLRSFADAASAQFPIPTIPESTDSLIDKTERDPLFLSLSLSMSSRSIQRPSAGVEKNIMIGNGAVFHEAEGEPLYLPMSLSISASLIRFAEQSDEDAAVPEKVSDESEANSRESLFGEDMAPTNTSETAWNKLVTGWRGFSQLEIADNYSNPQHFSKAKLRTELSRTGQFNENIRWKISGRFDYDAAYDLSDFYPPAVRRDQRYQFFVRENYLDVSAGDFDFRVGRQHVIWGEMVGLFFADVVSARDMREFLLPTFDIMRIPQWAVRAEYSKNDTHAELLWIPAPTIDNSGKPGADYYPGPLRGVASFVGEDRSGRNIGNSNYGFRLSQLIRGWDISAFYYHSLDVAPTFYRVSTLTEPLVLQPRHDEIDQVGATVTKDFGTVVFKGEMVYTDGRKFNVMTPAAINGLAKQNTLDYALGLDFNLPAETRLNLQFYQRVFFSYNPTGFTDRVENGASILLNGKVWRNVEAQALLIHSLNRNDWMFRPRLTWNFERNWRAAVGADIFGGRSTGFFGRFEHNDRAYTELRYSF